jgi:hypothetical protein
VSPKLNQVYDVQKDTWSEAAPPSLPNIDAGGATSGIFAPKRIYIYSEGDDSQAQSYDVDTNSWSNCAPVPTQRYQMKIAVLNDQLYVIGGYTLDYNNLISSTIFGPMPSQLPTALNEKYTPVGYRSVSPAPANSSIAPQTLPVIAFVAVLAVIVVSLLLYRRHQKTNNINPVKKV